MDNRTILEKADLALSDLTTSGGLLQPAQAAKFMRILIKQGKLMGISTVVPMRSPKQLIEKIRFAGRVLRAGAEATALASGDRAKPNLGKVELDAKLFKAEVRLDNEVLEDSIERSELRQTIMQILAERIATDIEEVAVNGDTTSGDPFLAQFNGILKAATSNVVDATDTTLNKTIFKDMLKALPSEFLRNKAEMRFITSVDAELDYRDAIADRQTIVGDKFLEQEAPIQYSGIPILDSQLFPENIGTGSHCTSVIFTDPKNINFGIWRNIRIETDKLVSEGVLIIVATLRFDVKYAEETAVVKAINVKVA
ncbi:MAG: phage major capsid protein [Gallionellaceae bacterium]|nr:MAG: phage major capsid protein [Gallionellaceae bacterium]